MPSSLKGWHPGEVAVQHKLGFDEAVRTGWQLNENSMREQHRTFHTTNLPFIPVTTIDSRGRPWASILVGADGEIGFVRSPNAHTLTVKSRLWPGEPLIQTVETWLARRQHKPIQMRYLTAGLGIELATRRRNKFAGHISDVTKVGTYDFDLTLTVNQTLGNCPKYINVRTLAPQPETDPQIAYTNCDMDPHARLPEEVINFITDADTVFIGTVYKAKAADAENYPSHAGMNARSGLPGFVRVRPSDGRTVVLPDYSGNRFMSSLGNIYSSEVAGLSIVSFATGDVLYLTGNAQVLIGLPALELMPRQATLCVLETTGYTLVRNALPVRQVSGTNVERSPYSPQVKYLQEEPQGMPSMTDAPIARLATVVKFAKDIATLHFDVTYRSKKQLKIRPGQAIALDFMDWMGLPDYQHMAADAPGSLNDDRVRTWTVSSGHERGPVCGFDLTMREKKGGAVTGALFDVIREHGAQQKYGQEIDVRALEIDAPVVGITGDFCLPFRGLKILWVAGGIGLTPFMAMLAALSQRGSDARGEFTLAISTREPTTFLRLIESALSADISNLRICIDIFTNEIVSQSRTLQDRNIRVISHKGRIQQSYWDTGLETLLSMDYALQV
ncbi:hypothetical protein N7510_011836 [Penicillium lagena]|uniref:uncharacterized protein n=1 Tax=Penicillium lagena TaxID=94218 RepID=UPI00254214C4|nr:uncharacterized protein N7510_011836 [Penicillium lagena]KAJ5598886.1 hypothetical protein N7510_011836 [Penicillium lagena]